MTEDELVGWHHRLDRHEFEQAPEVVDGHLGCFRVLAIVNSAARNNGIHVPF